MLTDHFWIRIVIYYLVTLLDLYCSWWLITRENGDIFYEANPVMAMCLANLGWPGLAVVKLIVASAAVGCIRLVDHLGYKRLAILVMTAITSLTATVVAVQIVLAYRYTMGWI